MTTTLRAAIDVGSIYGIEEPATLEVYRIGNNSKSQSTKYTYTCEV
jgi:hypothetical protein